MIRRALTGMVDWAYGVGWWMKAQLPWGSPDSFTGAGTSESCARPLVLIPGIWEPWRYLMPLARALHAHGHPVHVIPSLGANGSPVPAAASVVGDFLAERNLTGVVLVAHSKGGLIGKTVMLDPRSAGRVRAMVALSTPFQGSSLSWPIFARSPLGVFAPAGPVITDLAAQVEVNARIASVQPRHDQVIPEGSRLPGARNVTLDVAGHFRPLQDPRVHATIHDLIHELEAMDG